MYINKSYNCFMTSYFNLRKIKKINYQSNRKDLRAPEKFQILSEFFSLCPY